MTQGRRYWLMKSEPRVFSIEDLAKSPKQTTCWDGVRNYQARNSMRDDMKKGDLVFFYPEARGPEHVGIYIGDGEFIHAPHTGDVVKISSLDESSYSFSYLGAVRPY